MMHLVSWLEWCWGFLPDRCEGLSCSRRGKRGDEHTIGGRLMCNECFAAYKERRERRWRLPKAHRVSA
jgi:hypothetical protein